jgi:hypothetical protein
VFFRLPSWQPGHFLLLVQEKVTKENTPSAPRLACGEGSLRAAGFGKKASCLLAECARSLARTRADARA